MEAILVSAGAVALAEIGDKTQLLALLLAARFRAPLPVILGIFFATALNHTLAATVGTLVSDWLTPETLRWIVGVSFIAMAAWTLLPDKLDTAPRLFEQFGAFGATLVSFFIIEMGDKTQIATVALAARFHSILFVAIGTTIGMLIADVPVVFIGEIAAKKIPIRPIRMVAAALFFALGLAALLDTNGNLLRIFG